MKEVIKDLTENLTDGHRNMEESYFHKVETFTIIFTFKSLKGERLNVFSVNKILYN